jgi:ribosomal protein L10
MAINLDDKKAIVAEVQEAAAGAQSAVVADLVLNLQLLPTHAA